MFSRGKIRIDQKNIIKIGGDVIIVNVRCGDACASSVNVNPLCPPPPRPPKPPCSPFAPCPPSPPPRPEPRADSEPNLYDLGRIDTSDY